MDLREVVHRAWRWPLYSRVRAIAVLTAVVTIVAVVPQIGRSTPPRAEAAVPSTTSTAQTTDTDANPVPSEPMAAPESTEQPSADQPSATTTATAAAPTRLTDGTDPVIQGNDPAEPAPASTTPHSTAARPATGKSSVPSPSDRSTQGQARAIPGPPPLKPTPADFATPEAAASRWLQVWCWTPAEGAANENLSKAAAWMTTAGRDDDQTRRVTAESWARTKNAGLSTACDPATTQQPISAPQQPTVRWVVVTAQQTVYDNTDRIVERRQISQTRKVIKNATGRWLVDVEVQAG